MKKIIALIIICISVFAAYMTARYFINLTYRDNPNWSDFNHENGCLFIKMVLATILWAGIVSLIFFLIKKESEKKDEQTLIESIYDDMPVWAICSYGLTGIILMPLLVWVNDDITRWIIS